MRRLDGRGESKSSILVNDSLNSILDFISRLDFGFTIVESCGLDSPRNYESVLVKYLSKVVW